MADHVRRGGGGGGGGGRERIDPLEEMREQFNRDRSSFFHDNPNQWGSPSSHSPDPFFRTNRRNFPHHGFDHGFDRGFDRGFDHRGFGVPEEHQQHTSSSPSHNHVDSIPIRVIHEKTGHNHNNNNNINSSNNTKKPASMSSRKTTEIPSPRHQSQDSPRLERAHSEPPKTLNQRLAKAHHSPSIPENSIPIPPPPPPPPPSNIYVKTEDRNNPITTSASAPSVSASSHPSQDYSPQPSSPQPQQHQQQQQHHHHQQQQQQQQQQPPNSHVRHIPIVVEGRDTPVYNRKFSDTPSTSSNLRKPSDYYPQGTKKEQHHHQQKQRLKPGEKIEPTSPLSPPIGPIPMGYSAKLNEPTSPQPLPEGPIPLPCSPDLMHKEEEHGRDSPDVSADVSAGEANNNQHTDGQKSSDMKKKNEERDPAMEKVQAIQRDLADIMKRIKEFKGDKKDKEYLYLDEMLTRHLLSLDGIDSGGKEDIRKVRKESIKSVNRCLSLLDSRASGKVDDSDAPDAEKNNQILSDLAQESSSRE